MIEEEPLTREQEKFVAAFRKWRDIYKAAAKAGIGKNQAVKTFHLIQVQEEIERQDDAVRQERARQQVETENLTNAFLDHELIMVIRTETGALKKEAIQLGYIVTGRIQAGMTRILEPAGDSGRQDKPNFYQAFVPVGVAVGEILPTGQNEGTGNRDEGSETSGQLSAVSGQGSEKPAHATPVAAGKSSFEARMQDPAKREAAAKIMETIISPPAEKAAPKPVRKAGPLRIG